jgi:hypothetical protein
MSKLLESEKSGYTNFNFEGPANIKCHDNSYYIPGFIIGPQFVMSATSFFIQAAKDRRIILVYFIPFKN